MVDLVTVGEAFEDLIFLGLPRLPRPGEEIKTSAFVHTLGGGVMITAIAAARMGTTCRVVSGLSASAVQVLKDEHIQVTDLRRSGERAAISAALSTARNRTFVTYNGINDKLEGRLFGALATVASRHVHFAFYPRQCARWRGVIANLRGHHVTTSWDFGWNQGLTRDAAFPALLAELDVVFLNEQEARLYSHTRSLTQATRFWKAHARTAIIKLGARGSRWVANDLEIDEPAPRVRVVDTTGAGDAFNGGFLAARLSGRSARQCLRSGNRLGAQSTRAAGGINGLPRKRTSQ